MIRLKVSCLLILLLWVSEGWAQFNPDNPQEPFIQYKIDLECSPAGIAGLDGAGLYQDGSDVYINTYPYNVNYEFQYWEHNGEVYSRNSSFMYMISTHDAKFIAHYEYKPYNPDEPSAHFMRKLFIKTQPEGIATFNVSNGDKHEIETIVPIYETGRSWGYEFKGWYADGELLSNSIEFEFTVPDKDVTLVAHYEFNPDNPADPGSFYSTSCDFLAEPSEKDKGTVAVEGLEKGRAVFGSTLTLKATPSGDNTFCGWYMGDSLLSADPTYTFVVPSQYSRMYIVALFLYKPHNLTYMLDNEIIGDFVIGTGDSVRILPNVTKDGYVFSGWQNLPEIMPDNDVVVSGSLRLTRIRISQSSIQIAGSEKLRLKVYAGDSIMEEVTDITWSSANQKIASVSESGVAKGVGKGTTVISATLNSDSKVLASTSVNVTSDNWKVDLPSRVFEFNYNASNYDVENNRIINDPDAELYDNNLQLTQSVPAYNDGNRLTITELCKGYIDKWDIGSLESGRYFSRSGDDSLTIVCKVKPRYDNSTNRSDFISLNSESNTNFSLRIGYKNSIYLATRNLYSNRYLDYPEDDCLVLAVKAYKDKVVIQNLSSGQSKVLNTNNWGSASGAMNFFFNNASNYFVGDFYWAYLTKEYLSDSEIWDVVDYNENVRKDSLYNVIAGDANNSGLVNVTDISVLADYLFGAYPPVFNFKASDVNYSRTINVADIAGIVNLIYGLPVQQGASRRSSIQLGNNAVGVSFSPIDQNKEGVITVDVRNTSDISAVEMNLRLPEGLKVIDAEMDNERGGDRQFRYGYVDGGFKLMAYSANNKPLNGNAGKLFSIRVKLPDDIQQSSFEISLDDIVFSGRGDEIGLQSVISNWNAEEGTVTQVVEPDVVTETWYYDLLGREVSVKNMEKSPYIIREYRDGKVVRTYKAVR